ncbi:hypothetical protein C806_03370 [Lachnospiraceae bacterium 3-1]|nr:hypothetical protein C806_03370 [Lachnospiraceae bacterium 3-1]
MSEPISNTRTTLPNASGPKLSVGQIAVIGLMTAVTCVLAPFSVPIGPVPISLTSFAIYLSLYVLGMKEGTLSYLIYLLMGLIGLPVFSGFTSGPQKLLGPTGGYLIGFIPMVILSGLVIDHANETKGKVRSQVICFAGMIFGTIICYILGTAWLAYQANMDWKAALFAGVIPFIPGDLAKMAIAALAGPKIRRQLIQAGLRS